MHCVNEWCYITSIFNFLSSYNFTTQITLKQSLAQRLKLIFKFSSIKRQTNIPHWAHLGHKGWRKDGKTFIRCYTIALKFWDEFNVNFVLLYFLSSRSINIWHLYPKNVEKNKIFTKIFSILKIPCLGTQKNLSF